MDESLDKRVEWGELIATDEDRFVARGVLDGEPVVIKRFRQPEDRREIDTYEVLATLGVPTLRLIEHGADWLAVEDAAASPRWRPATEADLADTTVVRHLADWYARLHLAGRDGNLPAYDESEIVTDEALAEVAARWPDLAAGIEVARHWLPSWRTAIEVLPKTLTHNDFWWDNAVVARDGSAAIMIDYHLLGRGYRYADVRNVLASLPESTRHAFWADYAALAGGIDEAEVVADQRMAPLVALVMAERRECEQIPSWARAAAEYVKALA